MLEKYLQLKATALLVLILRLVVFEKHVNNKLVDCLEKFGLFSDSQYGFRSSRSTADLLIVVSDRTTQGLLKLYHIIYQRFLTEFWHAVFLYKLEYYRNLG